MESMKKYFLLIMIVGFGFTNSSAQTKLGVKLSPVLSFNRASSESDNLSVSPDGIGLRLSFGPTVDFFLKENYYFSTGLIYTPKRAAISVNDNGSVGEEDYKLQYLQIPATLKMFTNELAVDTRVYFQIGALPEIKIDEKGTSEDTYIRKFRTFDFSIMAGLGLEYRLGVSSTIYGGLSYTRGLVNVASKRYDNKDFILKNDLVSLDLGIKF